MSADSQIDAAVALWHWLGRARLDDRLALVMATGRSERRLRSMSRGGPPPCTACAAHIERMTGIPAAWWAD